MRLSSAVTVNDSYLMKVVLRFLILGCSRIRASQLDVVVVVSCCCYYCQFLFTLK